MAYQVLTTGDSNITLQEYHQLSELGAVVPYDPNSQYNNYIYIREESSLKELQRVVKCFPTGMIVPDNDVNKHIEKVKSTQDFQVGDLVYCLSKYRYVPLVVTDKNKDKVSVEFPLQGLHIYDTLDLSQISKAIEYFEYNTKTHVVYDKMLLVDCDSISAHRLTRVEYIHSFLLFLIRLKIQYNRCRLVLVNPSDTEHFLAKSFNLSIYYGKINNIVKPTSIVFTDDISLGKYCENLLTLENQCLVEHINYEPQDLHNEAEPYTISDTLDIEFLQELLLELGLPTIANGIRNFIQNLHG